MKTYDPERQYEQAVNDINEIINTITDPAPLAKLESDKNVEFTSTYTEEEFCDMVNKTKEYIFDGDIFQCVVSRRFETEYKGSLLNAYRVLRITNPSPYMVYMNIEGDEIISTSPETLVKLQNGVLNTFPIAGSRLSGAPKIRACQIIDELEKTPRGVYGGALGYVDFNGNLDTCIAIRMAVKKGNKVYVQAGAGIVADSDPKSEYLETYNKALAVINAVKNAGEVDAL